MLKASPLRYLEPQVVSRLSTMELRARLVVEGFITGLHRSPYHGFSVEFAQHRQYMPGDPIRHVDWKIFGRTDRYYIKQYEEETNLKSTILVDTSASMGFASEARLSKLTYSSYLAAALAYLMVQQRDAVGLGTFTDGLDAWLPPHATTPHLHRLLVSLERITAGGRTGGARALHQAADRMKRRGLVIVVSDLFDDEQEIVGALRHLRHRKNEVIVMHVLDPLERSFGFGKDALFRDMESGEDIRTQPLHIAREYRKSMQEFVDRIRRTCREHAIDYVLLDTATPYDVSLTEYLAKRARIQ
jgi:uncharacterized protein (DUF58 family)